jgi:hypothetical protein
MAYTSAMREATNTHQREQGVIRQAALADMLRLWPAWDLDDLDRTWQPVMIGLLATGEHYHRLSSMRAAAYYRQLRTLAGVPGEVNPVVPSFDRDQAEANLMLLGPIFTKKAIANNRPKPKDTALVRVSGAVTVMVLAGGRDTIMGTALIDPRAVGTRRVLAGTCDWCLQLKVWGQDGKGPMVQGRSWRGHTNCR